jgi:hypothetical protein
MRVRRTLLACHPEWSEGSLPPGSEILHFVQNDTA